MDLNGLDYNSSLIWESPEGIAVQPFYNKNTTEKTLDLEGLPEVWHHCALIYMGDLKIVNPLIENRIKKGIESFYLVCDELFDPEEFCPNTSLLVSQRQQNSGVLVRPITIAPELSQFSTQGECVAAILFTSSLQPLTVGQSATSTLPFITTGTP